MDSVQVYNCSQKDTFNAAIRFEGAMGVSSVTNSAFHNGLDHGVSVISSSNVVLSNNAFVGFRRVGMRIDSVRDVTVIGNFIGDVSGRGDEA